MRAIERDAEENLAARLARDTALSREHFPCPNCLEQGERHGLTYENGLFTCPECGGECDAAELIALGVDVRAGHVSMPKSSARGLKARRKEGRGSPALQAQVRA